MHTVIYGADIGSGQPYVYDCMFGDFPAKNGMHACSLNKQHACPKHHNTLS